MRELLGRYRRWRLENRTVSDAAVMDVALAVALALIAQYELWFTPLMVGPRGVHFVALLFMTLPLAWRQRAPFAVIAIVNVGAATQGLLAAASHDIASLLALLVAVYSVARHGDRRVALAGAGATVLGLFLYEVRNVSPLGIAFAGLLSLTAWVIGRVVRAYQEQAQALAEALEQQTATSDVLRIISSSPTDLRPVFEAMLANARRLCEADIAALFLYDGGVLRCAAHHNATPEFAAHLERLAAPPSRDTPSRLAALERRVVNVADMLTERGFSPTPAHLLENPRSVLAVPMLREPELIGVITTWRREVRPFSEKQVALIRTFADQAVIAIENVRLFHALEEKTDQLATASRHKSEFLANMSHELRTPLNAIIGFSEVLLERMWGGLTEKQQEYLQDILGSGKHLLSLINDILDLSKVEAGRMELEVSPFSLAEALRNGLVMIQERASRHGVDLRLDVDPAIGLIEADERKVKQVLFNLLSNAVKFTPDDGRIEVRAWVVDGEVQVSVADTGGGIAPDDQARVFEEFQQARHGVRKHEGTGLGLTLTKKIVELHGGRIWVESAVGKGSTFTFAVPLRRAQVPAERVVSAP